MIKEFASFLSESRVCLPSIYFKSNHDCTSSAFGRNQPASPSVVHFTRHLKAQSKTQQQNRAGKLFSPKYLRCLGGCPAACQRNIICCCELCALRYSKKARGDAQESRASRDVLPGNVQSDPCCHLGTAPRLSHLPEGVQGHPGDNPRQSLEVTSQRTHLDNGAPSCRSPAELPTRTSLPHPGADPQHSCAQATSPPRG